MAHQPSPEFLKSHPTATTIFSSHNRSSPSSSPFAAVSLPQPSGLPPPSSVAFILSDSDFAAAQHLLHLSSDTDADDASHNFSGHPAKATPIFTFQISRGGDDSNFAAPAPTSRKRRFASISAIYSRTKPLTTWKVRS